MQHKKLPYGIWNGPWGMSPSTTEMLAATDERQNTSTWICGVAYQNKTSSFAICQGWKGIWSWFGGTKKQLLPLKCTHNRQKQSIHSKHTHNTNRASSKKPRVSGPLIQIGHNSGTCRKGGRVKDWERGRELDSRGSGLNLTAGYATTVYLQAVMRSIGSSVGGPRASWRICFSHMHRKWCHKAAHSASWGRAE